MKKFLFSLFLIMTACQTDSVGIPNETSEIKSFEVYFEDNFEAEETFNTDLAKVGSKVEAMVESTASIYPTTVAGGVNTLVTITGSNFGDVKGQINWSSYYYTGVWMIESWSDKEIKAYVPAGAYTGSVSIYNLDRSVLLGTTNTLTVKYSIYPVIGGDSENGWHWTRVSFINEIVWHPTVGTDQALKDKFAQALDDWKCKTGVNWSIGNEVTSDLRSHEDGLWVFGRGDSPAAAHNSTNHKECYAGADEYYVSSNIIMFDERDDYAVVLHELGHALGHSHTNNSGSCMVASGSVSKISAWDAEGGIDKMNWSQNVGVSCYPSMESSICVTLYTYYQDLDGDGYGNPNISIRAEDIPSGYVTNNSDCNDSNPSINPSAVEIKGNGVDENCNGMKDDRIKGKGKGGDSGNGHGKPKKN